MRFRLRAPLNDRERLEEIIADAAGFYVGIYRQRVVRAVRNLLLYSALTAGLCLALCVGAQEWVGGAVFVGTLAGVLGWGVPLYFQVRKAPEIEVDVKLTTPPDLTRH